ncbi:hypothetical protein [Gynurincola endophyticus]|uniref:hypothetical protein n=1 Tax=Gynurincola endophyticus TaxID=2479004 RepID=UPI000F8EE3BF|nr:hypothetical protein [Gynurincola endophyticus]
MKSRKEFVLLPLLLMWCHWLAAQPAYFGGHPVKQKWEKIQSASTNIFYPKGWNRSAQLVAGYIHRFDSLSAATSLGPQSVQANIVLQPYTTQSNGYVAYGPFKSEFYLTGNPDIYSQSSTDWLQQLTFHEYRHIEQFRAFRKYPIPKAFYILFGEFGLDFYSNMVIPNYFWEGDAVYHETRFTNAGRGRTSNFYNPFRVIFENNKHYSWMQWRNGSMRKNIPNHYALGYIMASYGYEKYGDDFWKNITGGALNLNGLFYPFQRSFKKHYQISYKDFRKEAFQYYRSKLVGQDTSVQPTSDLFRSNQYWSYWLDETRYLYLENSYKKLPRFFVKNNSTKEVKELKYQWISNERQFHYNNDKIVYTSYTVHPRWHWTTFQDIVLYDLQKEQQTKITHKGKYFQPALNETGNQIIAIYQDADQNNLHLLSKQNETEWTTQEIKNEETFTYHHPRIYRNDIYTVVHTKDARMSIAKVSETGQHDLLFEPLFAQIGNFVIKEDTLYCNMNYQGRDRLFAYTNNNFYLLDHGKPNESFYFIDQRHHQFIYSDYELQGFTTQTAALEEFKWIAIDKEYWSAKDNYFTAAVYNGVAASTVNKDSLPVQKVAATGSPFRVYSWLTSPAAEDEINISVEGANILNNLYAYGEYNYNSTNRINKFNAGVGFGAWLSRLSLNFQHQGRSDTYTLSADTTLTAIRFKQNEVNISAAVPLTWYRKRSIKTLITQAGISKVNRENTDLHTTLNYNSARFTAQFTSYIPPAQNNIQTRWGYSVLVRFDRNWGGAKANREAFVGTLFLPGLSANHAFDLSVSHQNIGKQNQIALTEYITLARGFRQVFVHQIYKFASNYHLPLVYPDWGFGNIVYVQRIRTQLFYDASTYNYQYNSPQGTRAISGDALSVGAWLWLDGKIWNQHRLSLGLRYAHAVKNDYNLPFEQFIVSLPINF